MKKIGRFIVGHIGDEARNYDYEILDNLTDYNGKECIIVESLNPDLILLLNNLKLIITQRGSALAHLALVAKDYRVPIIIAPDISVGIPKNGKLCLSFEKKDLNKGVNIEIIE